MKECLTKQYDVISEYQKLKRNIILTPDEVLALKEREFYFENLEGKIIAITQSKRGTEFEVRYFFWRRVQSRMFF